MAGRVNIKAGTSGEFDLAVSVWLINLEDQEDEIGAIFEAHGDDALDVAERWCEREGYEIVDHPHRTAAPTTDSTSPRLFVIMGNDYPAGVMDDEAAAEALCKARMDAQRAELIAQHGESGKHYSPRIYWRVYPFDLNAIEN